MNPQTQHGIEKMIMDAIDKPADLEQLYRGDKGSFKKAFNGIFSEIKENTIAQVWNERLNPKQEDTFWGSKNEWVFLGILVAIAGLIGKIPAWTGVDEVFFYPRNLSFAVMPMITAYFLHKQKASWQKMIFPSIAFLFSALFINLLPDNAKSDTLILSCIHLPLFLWMITGTSFSGKMGNKLSNRVEFLQYNGDLLVLSAMFTLAGFLFSAITIGLFQLIGLRIEDFYGKYIIPWGAPAIPIIATSLVCNNPTLVNKISPLIARFFTPLVSIMLLVFLGASLFTGKDPYQDRDFLLLYNLLLIGVMAIILFSISGAGKITSNRFNLAILLGLALLTILVNGIALSAISFRIIEYGLTPNRIAVLGSNLLVFTNLIAVAFRLFKTMRGTTTIEKANEIIARFIPVYGGWAAIVAFVFPLLFEFK